MNVFVRVWADTQMRGCLAEAVVVRMDEILDETYGVGYPAVSLLVSDGSRHFMHWADSVLVTRLPAEDFHLVSKRKAAELATTDWLLIVDDDQLPLYRDWIGYAVSLTKRFPEYAAIAGWSVTHEVPRPESLIAESDSIGCPMIVKRAALLDATSEPIENPQRADTILTGRLQRHGKTGIARNWRYNHLGMGYSQVIPAHWMPECPV